MVNIENMKNENGELMFTKDGVQMTKAILEEGDKFVCAWKEPVAEKKGKSPYPRYTMACLFEGEEKPIIVDLKQGQYKNLMNKVKAGKPVKNQIFQVNKQFSEEWNKEYLALSYEHDVEPLKTFEEIRAEKEAQEKKDLDEVKEEVSEN